MKKLLLAGLLTLMPLQARAQQARTLAHTPQYELTVYSETFRQGDLIVAKVEPHKRLGDITLEYSVRTSSGTRHFTLPKLEHEGSIYALLGSDVRSPAQTADLTIKEHGATKHYDIKIEPRSFKKQYLHAKATTHTKPTTPVENSEVKREQRELYPGWLPITKNDFITRGYEQPRQLCDASSYGSRRYLVSGRDTTELDAHKGVDCTAPQRAPIHAALDGTVVRNGDDWFYTGNATLVNHGLGLYTLYAHQSKQETRVGERVHAGQEIGLAGRTGRASAPHLHWQAKLYGMNIDPLSLEVLDKVF